MFEILIRVKRVSHVHPHTLSGVRVNKESSICKPAICTGILLAVFLLFQVITIHASDITSQKVVDLANADRKDGGLGELTENDKLAAAAAAKAEDMIADDYFSHTAPDGTTPWRWIEKAGYDYNYAGENLAMDFVSADKMNQAWLASPTHRANILNEKYKDIGVAVREGIINGHETIAVVQMFGSGDNSLADGKKNKSDGEKKAAAAETSFPNLPPETDREKGDKEIKIAPIITSPQTGQALPGGDWEVFGRAERGTPVELFDNGIALASVVADDQGWFHLKITKAGEGNHILEAKSENISHQSEVAFTVDSAKPKIKYQLLAAAAPDEVTLEMFSDKPNCVFNVGTEKFFSSSGKYALTFSKGKWLSLSLAAEDAAGNKAFDNVNLSSFYMGSGKNMGVIGRLADVMTPQKIFAPASGEVALANNMGLTTGGKYNH